MKIQGTLFLLFRFLNMSMVKAIGLRKKLEAQHSNEEVESLNGLIGVMAPANPIFLFRSKMTRLVISLQTHFRERR